MIRKLLRTVLLVAVVLFVGQMTVGDRVIGEHFHGAISDAVDWCTGQWKKCRSCSDIVQPKAIKEFSTKFRLKKPDKPKPRTELRPKELKLPRVGPKEEQKKITAADRDSVMQLLP